jgi:lipoprotein-releasing system permease protein
MNWQFFVALRYLTSKRKERFISVISLISIAGIAVGVAALIIVISVMSGFDEDLKEKIVGTYSHLEIISDYGIVPSKEFTDKVLSKKHVMAASFFLNGQALIQKNEKVTGIIVKGIQLQGEAQVNKLGEYIKKGTLKDLRGYNVIIGNELANRLALKVGDAVYLIAPSQVQGRKALMAKAPPPPAPPAGRPRGPTIRTRVVEALSAGDRRCLTTPCVRMGPGHFSDQRTLVPS